MFAISKFSDFQFQSFCKCNFKNMKQFQPLNFLKSPSQIFMRSEIINWNQQRCHLEDTWQGEIRRMDGTIKRRRHPKLGEVGNQYLHGEWETHLSHSPVWTGMGRPVFQKVHPHEALCVRKGGLCYIKHGPQRSPDQDRELWPSVASSSWQIQVTNPGWFDIRFFFVYDQSCVISQPTTFKNPSQLLLRICQGFSPSDS